MSHDTTEERWGRGCEPREDHALGCEEHTWHESGTTVDECRCDTNLCNKEMGPIPETTTSTSTSTSEGIFVIYKYFYYKKKNYNSDHV